MTAERIPSQTRFRFAQWRMLLATMFCYLFYYTGRQNWGWAVNSLINEVGLSAKMIGIIAGSMLGAYGVGQFINGNLGDKYGGRRLMTLGAVLSCILCWVTSFGNSFISLLIPWTANGYVQSFGWAPGSRLISNWWGHNERAKEFGFYMFAASLSAVFTFAICILILNFGMSWRWRLITAHLNADRQSTRLASTRFNLSVLITSRAARSIPRRSTRQ